MRLVLLLAVLALAACGKSDPAGGKAADPGGYDASRDAAADIARALTSAKASHQRVLIEAGGDWSPRCAVMRAFYDANPTLAAARDKYFITVKVSVASGGRVPAALKEYPAPDDYPHLYVLDENGSLIQSQTATELEKGDSYDLERFAFFINEFGAPRP